VKSQKDKEEAEEAVLVRASQRGDREAFGLLVSRHAPSIFSLTTRMLGQTADAEDVAQETFVAAFKALSRFQLDAKFSTWLYRIAVNKCTDSLRSRRPQDISLDATEGENSTWEPKDDETPHWEFEQTQSWRVSSTRGSRHCRICIANPLC
jgi:RNA polymerase sigma-70 factor, ECF subfamily